MLQLIFEMITARLESLGLFATVGSALTDGPGALPAAEVWLADDKEKTETPAVLRELTWIVRVSASHEEDTGEMQANMFALLDAVRDTFVAWPPDGYIGVKRWWHVPQIKIESYKDHGSLVYLVAMSLEVLPSTFRKI
ncbi:MAG: hypothetical protein J0652_02615 [Desulfobulbaceae bacterium]|jgi:hypothetical protein|nr:hypothetical protein [Desulfobulbaceae bacterium]